MEQFKIIENLENVPTDKVKAPSAYSEIKELVSYKSLDQEEFLAKAQGIPSLDREPEENKISPASVPNTSNPEPKLNETLITKSPNKEQNHIKFLEEPSPKENSTGTSLKNQPQAKEQNGAKESTAAKNETNNLKAKPPAEDHQLAGKTSEEAKPQKDKTKDSKLKKSQAVKQEKDKDVQSNAAKKPVSNESQKIKPEDKSMDAQDEELIDQGSDKETQLEQEKRKTWKSLLTEVSLVSSLSTFKILYDKSSTLQSSDSSVRKRSAKQLYKKKLQILKENYTYRLRLLKQLKAAMKDKYNNEAQQLYSDYTSSKRTQGYLKNTEIQSLDFEDSKLTDPNKDPASLSSLS